MRVLYYRYTRRICIASYSFHVPQDWRRSCEGWGLPTKKEGLGGAMPPSVPRSVTLAVGSLLGRAGGVWKDATNILSGCIFSFWLLVVSKFFCLRLYFYGLASGCFKIFWPPAVFLWFGLRLYFCCFASGCFKVFLPPAVFLCFGLRLFLKFLASGCIFMIWPPAVFLFFRLRLF